MSSNIVQELRAYLDREQNHQFKEDFQDSLNTALGYNLPEFDGIKTLSDYLDFYEGLLKWVPTENFDGTAVYIRLCMFYFVLDLLPVSKRQSPIDPSTAPPYTWLSDWIIRYARELGKFMDSPDSISDESIKSFYKAENYHMWDYDRVDWKTFNEFFARKIKPEVRPIEGEKDNKVIVSPADAVFDGWWPVDNQGMCEFTVKGVPWAISQLLDDPENGASYGATFAGGKFCHSFLGPNDYHRQHAPVCGTVVEARVIPGLCYLEVEVVKDTTPDGPSRPHLGMHRHLDSPIPYDSVNAPNRPGYQFIQARALVLIDNPDLGLVAVLPIGMAQVSSVVLNDCVKPNKYIEKGQEISHFQFGGSDIVMVFQRDAKVNFTATRDVHYAFGKQVAVSEK
ncbi:phosphatidylserine decarboxylase-domain-containing protein [Lenzites betulinus]|nr:phosphatidylserine decarboxylase-domain-containing protein [Lenzites betulinus]